MAQSGRQITESSKNQAIFAKAPGPDNLAKSWNDALVILSKHNLDLETTCRFVLGMKNWGILKGGHRAIVMKVQPLGREEVFKFRLELEIDLKPEEHKYITGNFKCPGLGCNFETKSFQQFANHHLILHRQKEGDSIKHQCCGNTFEIFEAYAAHIYEKHQRFNAVTLQFETILPEKAEKFLDSDYVTFFEDHAKLTSFHTILTSALNIMNTFGSYFIFFWNCQDFAIWYLAFHGIPLSDIEPTLSDKTTGSGTDASARSIMRAKNKMWYKEAKQLKEFKLEKYAGEVICSYPECQNLPALEKDAYDMHYKLAHGKSKEKCTYK